tara:strand:- start:1993 stop:2376 length:384 start_codon:yes stop_codon:yes gene_type:complete
MNNMYERKKLFRSFREASQFAKKRAQLILSTVSVKRKNNKINSFIEVTWNSSYPPRYGLPKDFKDSIDIKDVWEEKYIPEAGTFNFGSEAEVDYLLRGDIYDTNQDDRGADYWEYVISEREKGNLFY